MQEEGDENGEDQQPTGDSFVNARLSELTMSEGTGEGDGAGREALSEERAAQLRAELQAALVAHAAEGTACLPPSLLLLSRPISLPHMAPLQVCHSW